MPGIGEVKPQRPVLWFTELVVLAVIVLIGGCTLAGALFPGWHQAVFSVGGRG